MAISEKVLDELLKDYKVPEDLTGEKGIFRELKKRLLERVLNAELTEHLGYEKNAQKPPTSEENALTFFMETSVPRSMINVNLALAPGMSNFTEPVLDTQIKGGFSGIAASDMKSMIIADEPVWAIGTGKTATPETAQS
ncbi:MAG: hypothetical protein A2020_02320 [Lentisphaerae bacterium GWF2_45_14]|nr:MAG: hypothetical protein A2020_02320 [Lentisphaerae bacterium GWF2_45_14]